MDFERCFFDYCKDCKECNCWDENYNLPREIQGQGDCKTSIDVQEDQKVWMTMDKEKKFRDKVREKNKLEIEDEIQKKCNDPNCNCFKNFSKKQYFADKFRQETKLDNTGFNNPWNVPYASWDETKPEKIFVFQGANPNVNFKSVKVLAETVAELKQKVGILFQIFQEYGEKPISECGEPQTAGGTMFENFWHLFDFNKRLRAAEEGIEKLTTILENLLQNSSKKGPFTLDDMTYRNPLTFEKMTIGERINFLKTRNDLLLDLMRDFLKAGSVEEICPRLTLKPANTEINQVFMGSELQYEEKSQRNCISQEELIDTLKKLRMQFNKIHGNKSENSSELDKVKNERRGENTLKCFGSKLEVISEQAELALNNESEIANLDGFRKKRLTLKENFSEINKETEEQDVNVYEVTSRLLAQEALLKSSLEKVQFEIFSKLDTPEKKYTSGNLSLVKKTEKSEKEEKQGCDFEIRFDSSSSENFSSSARDSGCIKLQTKYADESKCNEASITNGKCAKRKEFKEPATEKNYSCKYNSENICEENNLVSSKKMNVNQESKPKFLRKAYKNTFTILSPSSKSKIGNCLTERCSTSCVKTKTEIGGKDKRPMTVPNSFGKSVPPSGLKPPCTEKSRKKNLGLNNVRNKNKILLSKKSFVGTS